MIMNSGTLFFVPTPVGNLKDITYRAVEVLKNVNAILSEDTRKSGILLDHYNIKNRVISHHKFNEHKSTPGIIKMLSAGEDLAYITDAGTPGISDPGFYLVRECIENNISVECLPGATAFIPALVVSGLPDDKFVFEGFLPHKKGRQKRLKQLKEEERTIVFYESPYRVLKLLKEFREYYGTDRKVSISREISKKYEETLRGNPGELIEHYENKNPKGEFVIILNGKNK